MKDVVTAAKQNGDQQAAPMDSSREYPGLTKREHIAALMMQGILASEFRSDIVYSPKRAEATEAAVGYADALLLELEK